MGKRGPVCTICTHPDAVAIADAIHGGTSFAEVARRFGVHGHTLAGHANRHLGVVRGLSWHAGMCVVCEHRCSNLINVELLQGDSQVAVGERWGFGSSTMSNHARRCLGFSARSRGCVVCDHPKRAEMEERVAEGEKAHALAREYGLTDAALWRHMRPEHLARTAAEAAIRLAAVLRYVEAP